jgi:hypothetical protein
MLRLESHVFPTLYGCVFNFITFMLCLELVFNLIHLEAFIFLHLKDTSFPIPRVDHTLKLGFDKYCLSKTYEKYITCHFFHFMFCFIISKSSKYFLGL